MPLLNVYQYNDLPRVPARADMIELYLDDSITIEPADLDHLPTGLRVLRLRRVSYDGVAHIAARFPELEELRLSIDLLPEGALEPLSALKRLHTFELWASPASQLPDIASLAHITTLVAWQLTQLDSLLRQLHKLPALKSLGLWHTPRLTTAAMATIAGCKDLQELRLSSADPREHDALIPLKDAPALRLLALVHGAQLGPREAAALAAIPTLQSVLAPVSTIDHITALKPLHDKIARLKVSTMSSSPVDDPWIDALVDTLPNLRGLNLLGAQQRRPKGVSFYTPAKLARLAGLKQLEWLDTGNLPKEVKPDDLTWLSDLPALTHLRVYGASIGPKIVDALKGCAALRTLSLDDVKLSDAAAKKLAGLSIERLKLHHAPLTDKGLAEIAKIKTLQSLYMLMEKGQLGDAGIAALASLPALKVLQIDLWSCTYLASSLAPLAANPSLERLAIDPHVNAYTAHLAGLATLAGAPALWHVELGTYSQGPLDAAAAAALKTIPNLLLVGAVTEGHDLLAGHALATTQYGLHPEIVPALQQLD